MDCFSPPGLQDCDPDGELDQERAQRDLVGADVAVLVVDDPYGSVSGVAWSICRAGAPPHPSIEAFCDTSYGFAVVAFDSADGNWTMSHEIGHILGGFHDAATNASSCSNDPECIAELDEYNRGDRIVDTEGSDGFSTVMYAYSGWNGTTYIAGEIREPGKNMPRALVWATALITFTYLAINVVFLLSSSGQEILADGKYTIGSLAATNLFGPSVSPLFNLSIVLILLSSVSVQMMVGPRVCYAMAQDKVIFRSLGKVSKKYFTPYAAIAVQAAIAILYAFVGFDAIRKMLIYMGFALSIFPFLAVLGMVYWRYKHPAIKRPFKAPFFPLVPAIYLTLSFVMMLTTLITNTIPSLFALGVVGIGTVIFFLWKRFLKDRA